MADDDDSIATIVKTALRLDGFELIRARDGEEALQLARAAVVDLILLDVQMPLLDGFAVCRALRAEPALAAIPIIMLTGQRDPEDLQTGFAEGATDQLRARVRTWLARSGRASP
jgi:CheY-like chemotaxis protein